ncbi:unnamed protein product [Mytilus coruscus]|uniref:Ankyrin repeat protein n=1 Tax=Mytilus coruscus TaxID=42192 RepID=A0A6J8E5H7_MYTCO|nr:unnamed protein product [Mytilus coruscus]
MKSTIKHLLEFGFLEIVAWILQNVDPKQIAMNEACCNGFLDSFHWMQCNVNGALLNLETVINIAIYRNNFETVKWMILNNDHTRLDIQEIMYSCCLAKKSFSEAKFIIENVDNNVLNIKKIMNKACRLGNLFIVKFLLKWMKPVFEAIYEGRLDVVRYLLSNVDQKALDITKTFNEAWRCGHLEIVKYMIENLDHTLLDMKESVNKALKLHRTDILESILRSPNKKTARYEYNH